MTEEKTYIVTIEGCVIEAWGIIADNKDDAINIVLDDLADLANRQGWFTLFAGTPQKAEEE